MKKNVIGCILVFVLLAFPSCARKNSEDAASNTMDWMLEESDDDILPGVEPSLVIGDIISAGSSTVFPLAEALGTRFRDEGYAYNLTIDSIGSGAGFERFTVAGETDISNASRPIKEKEIDQARAIGREPIEIRLGTDVLTVVVNPDNTWTQNLSLEQLAMLFTADTWNEVDPSWPNEQVLKFIPGTDSGTFDFFVEEVFDKDPKPILSSPNIQASEDDNILVRGVINNVNAVSFFGYAYYVESADALQAVAIEGVKPLQENVDNNSYPLSRPLFMYSDASILKERPQVAAFLIYILTYVNDVIIPVGYFPAPEIDLLSAKQKLLTAIQ